MDFYTMNTPRDREINITELQKPAVNLFFIPIPTSLSELPPYWPFVVQSLSCVRLFATPGAAARQASLSCTSPRACSNSCPLSQSSVIPFSSCLQSFPESGSFSMSWLFTSVAKVLELQHQSFQWIIINRLISLRIDWFDLLAVQGTLKNFLQHHSLKASVLWCSTFFMVQLSHPYRTTGKTIV